MAVLEFCPGCRHYKPLKVVAKLANGEEWALCWRCRMNLGIYSVDGADLQSLKHWEEVKHRKTNNKRNGNIG